MSKNRCFDTALTPRLVEVDEAPSIFSPFYMMFSNVCREGTTRFAFLEFEDPRDAEDAVRREDGGEMGGARMRVRQFTRYL